MFPLRLKRKLDELRLRFSDDSPRRKAVYKYFLSQGMSIKEIDENVYFFKRDSNNTDLHCPFKLEFFLLTSVSDKTNNYSYYIIDNPHAFTTLKYEPMAVIDGFLIQRTDNFNSSQTTITESIPYYFSVYSHVKGSLEYGPFEGYDKAQIKITEIKAIVNMNEDNEIRYYSDPYSRRYGYTDKLVQQALES